MGDHRIERAFERYGVTLDKIDIFALGRQIEEGRSVLVSRDAHAEQHLVKHGEVVMVAVWGLHPVEPARFVIKTFLAPEMLVSGSRRAHYGGPLKVKKAKRRRQKYRPEGRS